MSSNPLPEISATDLVFAQLWAESTAHVLEQLAGSPFTSTPLSPATAGEAPADAIWSRFAVGMLAMLGLFQLFTSAYKMGYMWLFWALFLLIFGMRHPAIVDPSPVGRTRTWLGVLALVIFILSFTAAPIRTAGP